MSYNVAEYVVGWRFLCPTRWRKNDGFISIRFPSVHQRVRHIHTDTHTHTHTHTSTIAIGENTTRCISPYKYSIVCNSVDFSFAESMAPPIRGHGQKYHLAVRPRPWPRSPETSVRRFVFLRFVHPGRGDYGGLSRKFRKRRLSLSKSTPVHATYCNR